jgi:hypothetical protein
MKIAVCYSGLIRHLPKLIENHRKTIYRHYNCDILMFAWDIYGFSYNGWGTTITPEDTVIGNDVWEDIRLQLNPKQLSINSFTEIFPEIVSLADRYTQSGVNKINVVSMAYGFDGIRNMLSNLDYDIVIRNRTDLEFETELTIPDNIEENTIYTPSDMRSSHLMNDQFGLGTQQSMMKYFGVIDTLRDKENTMIHPETTLKKHLEINDLKIKSVDLNYRILR